MSDTVTAHDAQSRSGLRGAGFCVDASSWISWASFALAFAITVVMAPDAVADMRSFSLRTQLLLIGVVLFFAAIVLIQWRMQHALKAQHFGQPQRLYTAGAFALSRNPMYVCFLLPLAAWALWSPLASATSIAIYVVAMNLLVIRREEAVLRATFGAEYATYAIHVPRWLLPLG